jgi:predicted methyltransferase
MIYRAGYPIRFDDKTKNIMLAKTGMGLNIRIYRMSEGDVKCKTIGSGIDCEDFDLWREIQYYEWARNRPITDAYLDIQSAFIPLYLQYLIANINSLYK